MTTGAGAEGSLNVLPEDRRCRRRALDNRLRRWMAPPSRELDRLAPEVGMSVADLGTGVGYFAAELARRVGPRGKLYLVDPDGESLALAARKLPAGASVTTVLASAARVPEIADGSVDRVLLFLVLCCLVDKTGTMEEAWRILRPGGRILVTYPGTWWGVRPSRRGLRVTASIWTALRARHPWREVEPASGRLIHRHLLEKPST